MALERNTMLCLAVLAIGGAALGAVLFTTFYEKEVTVEYYVEEEPMWLGQHVATYYLDMTGVPDGAKIWFKEVSDDWHYFTWNSENSTDLEACLQSREPYRNDSFSMEFKGESDGYKFVFKCTYRPH
jgi:hypothetical protein